MALHPYPFTQEVYIFKGLVPWVHFIPLKPDARDLLEKYHWCHAYSEAVEKIIDNANDYMKPYFNEDLHKKMLTELIKRYSENLT